MAMIMGSGAAGSRGGGRSLADRLMGDFVPHREESGGDRLRHDLGMDESSGWSGNSSSGQSGGSGSYGLPSVGGSEGNGSSYSVSVPEVSMPSQTMPVMNTSLGMVQQAPQPQLNQTATMLPISVDTPSDVQPIAADQLGVDMTSAAGLDAWEANRAKEQNRPIITTNLFGEEFDKSDRPLGAWDNQLNLVGNTRTNDAYLRDLVDSGRLTMDEAHTFTVDPSERLRHLDEWRSDPHYDIDLDKLLSRKDSDGQFSNIALDDGLHDDWMSITADAMTGTQYQHYRDDLGMGGRDDIDPTGKYSKRQEQVANGFMPFTPHVQDYVSGALRNAFSAPTQLGGLISDIRSIITPDYEIEYGEGDNRKTINGSKYDAAAQSFIDNYYRDIQYDKEKFLKKPTDGSSYEGIVKQFEVPDVEGKPTYHYGVHVETTQMPDGNYQLAFSDGTTVRTTPEFADKISSTGLHYEQVPLSAARSLINEDQLLDRNKYQYLVNEYVIPDAYTGEDTYHYIAPAADGFTANGDGTYSLRFADDSVANLSSEWIEQNLDENGRFTPMPTNRVFADNAHTDVYYEDTDAPGLVLPSSLEQENPERYKLYDDPNTAPLAYFPNMVLDDGTVINSADAIRLWNDRTPNDDADENGFKDDDIKYNFDGIAGDVPILGDIIGTIPVINQITNRPRRLGSQEIFSEDFDPSNLMNMVTDWTAGSIPISLPGVVPWVFSASNALDSMEGGNAGTYTPAMGYEMLTRGGYDENGNLFQGVINKDGSRNDEKSRITNNLNTLGTVSVPLTEMMVGPIGEFGLPIGRTINKYLPSKSATGEWLRNLLIGAVEEGIEENLGNMVEEPTQYGVDAWGSPVINEATGQPMRDLYGNEIREDVSDRERLNGMLSDVFTDPNAFAGGALVSGAMEALPGRGTWIGNRSRIMTPDGNVVYGPRQGGLSQAIMQDRARHASGASRYVPVSEEEDEKEFVDLGPEYASLFDNMIVEGETEEDARERDRWRHKSELEPTS